MMEGMTDEQLDYPEADRFDQLTPVDPDQDDDEEGAAVVATSSTAEADEADLLEQATPVRDDDGDYPPQGSAGQE